MSGPWHLETDAREATSTQVKVTKRWCPALLQLSSAGGHRGRGGQTHGDCHICGGPSLQGKVTPFPRRQLPTSEPQPVFLSAWSQDSSAFSFSTRDPSQEGPASCCFALCPQLCVPSSSLTPAAVLTRWPT